MNETAITIDDAVPTPAPVQAVQAAQETQSCMDQACSVLNGVKVVWIVGGFVGGVGAISLGYISSDATSKIGLTILGIYMVLGAILFAQEIYARRQFVRDLTNIKNELKETQKQYRNLLGEYQTETEKFKAQNILFKRHINSLNKLNINYAANNDDLEQQVDEIDIQTDQLEAILTGATTTMKELIAARRDEARLAKQQLDGLTLQVTELTTTNGELSAEVDRVKRLSDKIQGSVSSLEEENETLTSELDKLEKLRKKLFDQVNAQEKERKKLEAENKILIEQVTKLRSIVAQMSDLNADGQKLLKSTQNEINKFAGENQKLASENQRLKEIADQLQLVIDSNTAEKKVVKETFPNHKDRKKDKTVPLLFPDEDHDKQTGTIRRRTRSDKTA